MLYIGEQNPAYGLWGSRIRHSARAVLDVFFRPPCVWLSLSFCPLCLFFLITLYKCSLGVALPRSLASSFGRTRAGALRIWHARPGLGWFCWCRLTTWMPSITRRSGTTRRATVPTLSFVPFVYLASNGLASSNSLRQCVYTSLSLRSCGAARSRIGLTIQVAHRYQWYPDTSSRYHFFASIAHTDTMQY